MSKLAELLKKRAAVSISSSPSVPTTPSQQLEQVKRDPDAVTPILLFLGTPDDEQYLPRLKQCLGGATVFLLLSPISTIAEITIHCRKRNITGVISTSQTLLSKLVGAQAHTNKEPKLTNYAGSLFIKDGIESRIVGICPIRKLKTFDFSKLCQSSFIDNSSFS